MTASVEACTLDWKDACSLSLVWQVTQNSAPLRPWRTRISDLSSPLESMCLAPAPWQEMQALVSQPAFPKVTPGIRV